MKKVFFLLVAVCMTAALSASTVNYTADNTSIFTNPERGFITMIGGVLSEKNPYGVKGNESSLNKHASNDKGSIVLVHYYLTNYRKTTTIPSKILNAFDEDMEVLRSKGMKAIIRFSYTESSNGDDAAWSYVKEHIRQYKSHWQANADVIFCFQAGIVGAWGEWYYTQNYGDQQSTMNSSRRLVVDSLLAAVPADRCIQLRTPLFKTGYVGNTKALTAEEAYTGTPKARLGHHNDAFLYDYDNMGTYSDTAKQKPYLAQETLYVPLGGETDITEADKAQQWATYEKTTAEMSRLHWTFIQSGYAETTTNMWRNNGTFDELNRKLGYRYQLVNGTYSDQVAAGGKLAVKMQIRNAGYAPLYNERPAYIVLKNGNKTYQLKLAADPRRWLPNGQIATIDEQLTVPSNVPAGTYQLYLYLPDAYASIASNPKYAVRFANNDIWDANTGMNKLNASVTVTSGSGPVDPPQPQGDAILLPATLNKANVTSYSSDMTWYNTDYFDFGPDDGANLDRWAEWNVELRYPGEYIMSAEGYYPNGHEWQVALLNNNDSIAGFHFDRTWAKESLIENGSTNWVLTNIPKGVYTIRVTNVFEWSQPKLKSLTLQYDGELPLAIEQLTEDQTDNTAYDLLGRPVDDNYRGIVIMRGRKILR